MELEIEDRAVANAQDQRGAVAAQRPHTTRAVRAARRKAPSVRRESRNHRFARKVVRPRQPSRPVMDHDLAVLTRARGHPPVGTEGGTEDDALMVSERTADVRLRS